MSDIREDFEEAAARLGFSLRMRDPGAEDGEYQQWQTQGAWDMWQEAHALYTQPQSDVPEWIKCSDRLPTMADGDLSNNVWCYDEVTGEMELEYVHHAHGYTHWMSTGLTVPAKPQNELAPPNNTAL